jgi:4a-hydroxytetrahydrobiopterin dehydratase
MTELAEQTCTHLAEDTPPLEGDELDDMAEQLADWDVEDDERIWRLFEFPDFATALAFVNQVGVLAEQQHHHPDINLSWGSVRVELSTHSIGGLSVNDFILAAKIDQIPRTA